MNGQRGAADDDQSGQAAGLAGGLFGPFFMADKFFVLKLYIKTEMAVS